MTAPIQLAEETHAEIAENATCTWVNAKDFAVYIIKTDDGLVVDIYAKDYEDCYSLASAYAFDTDAAAMRDTHEANND